MRNQKLDFVNTCKNFSSLLRWSPNPIPSPRPLPRPRPIPGKINLSNASTRQHCRHAQIVDGWMHILKMISQSYPLQKHQVSFEFLASPSLAPPSLFPRHISWSITMKDPINRVWSFRQVLMMLLTLGCFQSLWERPFWQQAGSLGGTGGPPELPSLDLFSSLKIINVLYEFAQGSALPSAANLVEVLNKTLPS